MGKTLSTGSTYNFASAYGTAKAFSSITNAAEAVASFGADPGLAAGDYVEVTSGWGRLNNRLMRVKTVSGAGPYLVTLEGMNTSDVALFPAGSGAGSVRKITTWTQITQVKEPNISGGEVQMVDTSDMDSVVDTEAPVSRGATKIQLVVYDDPSLAWYTPVVAVSDVFGQAGYLNTLPNGSKVVAQARWNIQKIPDQKRKEYLTAKLDVSLASEPMRYAT